MQGAIHRSHAAKKGESVKHIGIYGGSFDPIHDGHLAVARGALKECGLDEVWLMVSPENPLKAGHLNASENARLDMAKASIESNPEYYGNIKVSDFEFRLPRPSFTIATLRELKNAFPDCHFRWIVGADNLVNLSKWKDPDKILSEFGLIVYPRPGFDFSGILPEGITLLSDVEEFPYSSTEVRTMISKGENPDNWPVPNEVKNYITAHPDLYRE